MAENSNIEWTTHTFNPWRGCRKVHTGCKHCYAETRANRFDEDFAHRRIRLSDTGWREPLKWNRKAEESGERHRVFCASLADVFEDWDGPIHDHNGRKIAGPNTPDSPSKILTMNDLRRDLFELIDKTPHLDWLLLTKRPQNIRPMWPMKGDDGDTDVTASDYWYHRENVQLGTSVSDQATADAAIAHLLECRDLSPVLFLSAEPLLGPVNLDLVSRRDVIPDKGDSRYFGTCLSGSVSIDWVIVGGESGPRARPCNFAWIRDIRDQCRAAGVPCFIKQLGADPYVFHKAATENGFPIESDFEEHLADKWGGPVKDKKGGDWDEWPEDLRVREFPQISDGRE